MTRFEALQELIINILSNLPTRQVVTSNGNQIVTSNGGTLEAFEP